MPPKFFITHSWSDIDFARRLYTDLRANELDGFFDDRSIRAGELISDRIQQGLEACDVYVPILSHAAFGSPWCKYEINFAITLSRERGRDERPHIIPILIDDSRAELKKVAPLLLMHSYLTLDAGYERLLYRLLFIAPGVSPSGGCFSRRAVCPLIHCPLRGSLSGRCPLKQKVF